jgi:hypothetical protein
MSDETEPQALFTSPWREEVGSRNAKREGVNRGCAIHPTPAACVRRPSRSRGG